VKLRERGLSFVQRGAVAVDQDQVHAVFGAEGGYGETDARGPACYEGGGAGAEDGCWGHGGLCASITVYQLIAGDLIGVTVAWEWTRKERIQIGS